MLLLTFHAGPNRYAIDSARVVELIPRVELRSIPRAPAVLAGLLTYRGAVIPVIDLGLLLGDAPCRSILSTRIMLVNDRPGDQNRRSDGRGSGQLESGDGGVKENRDVTLLGLVAEQVSDLTYTTAEQFIPPPVQLREVPYLDAIVQTEHGVVQLIAVERIRDAVLGELTSP